MGSTAFNSPYANDLHKKLASLDFKLFYCSTIKIFKVDNVQCNNFWATNISSIFLRVSEVQQCENKKTTSRREVIEENFLCG